jgi:hypothetical protein
MVGRTVIDPLRTSYLQITINVRWAKILLEKRRINRKRNMLKKTSVKPHPPCVRLVVG